MNVSSVDKVQLILLHFFIIHSAFNNRFCHNTLQSWWFMGSCLRDNQWLFENPGISGISVSKHRS